MSSPAAADTPLDPFGATWGLLGRCVVVEPLGSHSGMGNPLAFRRRLQEACATMASHAGLPSVGPDAACGALPFRVLHEVSQAGAAGRNRAGGAEADSADLSGARHRSSSGSRAARSCPSARRNPFAASSTPAATHRSTIVPPRQRFTLRFTWRVRLSRLSMAFVVASDRWRRSDRPKPSTVSTSHARSASVCRGLVA